MSVPRILIQMLLLPILAVMLPLIYGLAWLREAIDDLAPKRVPLVVPARLPRRGQ